MSNIINTIKKNEDKSEIEEESNFNSSIIRIPVISSKSNDISKLDCSNIEDSNKNIDILKRLETFKEGESSNQEKKDSNFSSMQAICDEINKAEKYLSENKWYFIYINFFI